VALSDKIELGGHTAHGKVIAKKRRDIIIVIKANGKINGINLPCVFLRQ